MCTHNSLYNSVNLSRVNSKNIHCYALKAAENFNAGAYSVEYN